MSTEQKRILLIEDNRADAALLEAMLDSGAAPCSITWTDRLKSALTLLPRDTFDAILLDLSLPDSHGMATLEKVQAAAQAIPIIIVTGREDEQLAISSLRRGAQDYLLKDGLTGRSIARAVQYAIDRKQAELALRRSEQRYHALFNAMNEGFALHEIIRGRDGEPRDYRFLDLNPAFERLTGLKREDVLGKTVRDKMPHDEPVWLERYRHVALTGEPDHFDHASARFGRHYEVTAYRTGPDRFAVLLKDVTELKAMQRREKEDAVRLAWGQSALDTISAMREGVLLLELDGTIISINPAVERLTGLVGGEIVGRKLATVLPGLLGEAELGTVLRGLELLRSGTVPELPPLLTQTPDGKISHVLPGISLIEAPAGRKRVAVLTLTDVTDVHEAARRLEQSERKYRELVENASSLIMRVTPEHKITFFNEYAQTFFGYEAAEVLGRSVVGTIVPEVDSQGRDSNLVLREALARIGLDGSYECENVCKSGRRVWVQWANRAVRDEQGAVTEILCVGTDITLRREMEAEAVRSQQRLRALTERLSVAEEEERWRISRRIHDSIIQNLSLANIRLGSVAASQDDAREEARSTMREARDLLVQAIDDCRMVMSDLTPALLYELGLIPALRELGRRLAEKHGARISIEDDGCEKSMSHPLRAFLFESAREMIMNALKHAGPCELRVAARCSGTELMLTVTDTGCGFNARTLGKTPDHHGGFGLFNIRQRLEGLGGRLEIESAPGRGTRATIVTPLEAAGR